MRTTPTAVMGLIACVEPLHIAITAGAAQTMGYLLAAGRWAWGTKRTRFPRDIISLPTLAMRQDKMAKHYNFTNLFQTCIPEWEAWKKDGGNSLLQGDIWYTNGSKGDEWTGAGLYDSALRRGLAIPPGRFPTVFQMEVFAILRCAEILRKEGKVGKCITICCDSQAAITAVGKPDISSILVWECKEALNQLVEGNKVNLLWVPGHKGIRGCERADQQAKNGAARRPIGPEPLLGLAACCTKLAIKNWVVPKHESYWEQVEGCRQAKAILGIRRRVTRAREILSLLKKEARIMIQMLKGHNHFNYHKYKLGLCPTTTCNSYGRDDETSIHVLCQCPAFAEQTSNPRLSYGRTRGD